MYTQEQINAMTADQLKAAILELQAAGAVIVTDATEPVAAPETPVQTDIEGMMAGAGYKNNNYRNWEWSAGYGQHGGDRYVPVEVQRNFSKDAAVIYEQHVGGHQSGFEVKYTVKIDKLFGLF